ncbi:cell wall hydrolase [Rhodospirillaceae bacterium KN72]|uniref:Cell wall hydrolase n=1 Tax=Pacificispira spongiicola TaxID=2729598 RepID=A0A7Y0E0Z5_9PROT|nr:cell wall hydrolase [Pacificispira spongiicola]NMM45220.1 cell wall hydrolase [Pacificispira spongiicola]
MTHIDLPIRPFFPRIADQETSIDTLARTLWGEAYGDSVRGKEAVAAVVMNRLRAAQDRFGGDWWGTTVVEACLASDLFECWRRSPQSRRDLMLIRETDPVFATCRRIAARAVRGALVDPTYGATYYHRLGDSPVWSRDLTPSAVIGRRKFYRIAP